MRSRADVVVVDEAHQTTSASVARSDRLLTDPFAVPTRTRGGRRTHGIMAAVAAVAATALVLPTSAQATVHAPEPVGAPTVLASPPEPTGSVGSARITISAPATVPSGRSTTVTATISAVPTDTSVSMVMPGLVCGGTSRVTAGTARTVCTYQAGTPGGSQLLARATLYASGEVSGTLAGTQPVTSVGVATMVPTTIRRGTRPTVRFAVGTTAAPGSTLRLLPGVTGATGCPSSIYLRADAHGSATYSCAVSAKATATIQIVPQVTYGTTTLTGTAVSRPVEDGAALSAAAAEKSWREVTEHQYATALAAADVMHDSATTGFEIVMRAHRDGWTDPAIAPLVRRLLDLRNADGGWGLSSAWDAFGDRTINPATTTYTVSTADHAGPALLGAWEQGLVTDADLRGAVDSLLATPTWSVPGGLCVSYSTSAYDTGKCVPNVSFGAAAWLKEVRQATGWSIPRLDEVVDGVTGASRYLFQEATGYWAYSDLPSQRTVPQDPAHQGYTLESMLGLSPALAETATATFLRPWWLQPTRYTAVMYGNGQSRVAFTDCTGAARSPALLEAFRSITTQPGQEAKFLALQYAVYGQRVLDTCFAGRPW
ncbi:MAG TPA: hypothetical protein VFL94_03860 [Actinomycetales bacterium]|nr:hypothetical protein [Actinomycetales bacterium]